MTEETYTVKIGAIECTVIGDGTHPGTLAPYTSPVDVLFPGVPEKLLRPVLQEHNVELKEVNDWIIPFVGLLVKTRDQMVLIDTGADGLGPDTGKLLRNLEAVGVKPEDIDIIIHTHAHRDHLGGNTDGEGNLVFWRARYLMWKDEWDFWTAEETKPLYEGTGREAALEWALRNLIPIKDRVELIDRDGEILSGIKAISAPGHTPGHMALSIESMGEELLCLGDTVHHVIHLEHPEWALAIDFDREQVNATRRRLLSRAAEERSLVFAPHLPFPGLGHVIPKGDAWQWLPIDA